MVKKNKKILSYIVSVLLIVVLLNLAACVSETEQGEEECLYLNYEDYVLDVYEEVTLYTVDEKHSPIELDIAWSSSNDSVATVNEGKVRALKEGMAIIKATSNGITAQCMITVSNSNTVPEIRLNITEDTLNISEDSDYYIEAELYYKNKPCEGAVFTYIVEDESIITVDGTGKLTGINKGTSYLTIKTTWLDFNPVFTTKSILVNVK